MGSCALLSRRPWPRGGRAPGQVAGRRPDERLLLVVICWTRQEPGGIGPRRGPGPCRDASQQPGRAGRPAAGAGRRRALPLSVLAPAHGVLSAGCRSSIGRWHSCLRADPERRGSRDRRPDVGSCSVVRQAIEWGASRDLHRQPAGRLRTVVPGQPSSPPSPRGAPAGGAQGGGGPAGGSGPGVGGRSGVPSRGIPAGTRLAGHPRCGDGKLRSRRVRRCPPRRSGRRPPGDASSSRRPRAADPRRALRHRRPRRAESPASRCAAAPVSAR